MMSYSLVKMVVQANRPPFIKGRTMRYVDSVTSDIDGNTRSRIQVIYSDDLAIFYGNVLP